MSDAFWMGFFTFLGVLVTLWRNEVGLQRATHADDSARLAAETAKSTGRANAHAIQEVKEAVNAVPQATKEIISGNGA